VGMVLFVPLFLLTFSSSQMVEKSAKSFIESKLHNEINEKIDALKVPQSKTIEKVLGSKAQDVYQKADEKSADFKLKLKEDASSLMAIQLAKMADPTCECRTKWKERLSTSPQLEATSFEKVKEKLTDFIHGRYMQLSEKLTRDLRILLGVNALLCIALLLISFLKPQATAQLLFASGLLLLSTGICAYCYIFKQNWFYTMLYNDAIGFGFLLYFVIVFAVLSAIFFTKAKIINFWKMS